MVILIKIKNFKVLQRKKKENKNYIKADWKNRDKWLFSLLLLLDPQFKL